MAKWVVKTNDQRRYCKSLIARCRQDWPIVFPIDTNLTQVTVVLPVVNSIKEKRDIVTVSKLSSCGGRVLNDTSSIDKH